MVIPFHKEKLKVIFIFILLQVIIFSLEEQKRKLTLVTSNMSDLNTESTKPWNIYTASNPGPSQTAGVDEEAAPWKSFGTSMTAISFGFVATAILISMFLIMAIFEHLFKPTPQFSSPQSMLVSSQESVPTGKQRNKQTAPSSSYASDISVLMPGQQYPTYIAQPAPLPPCPREGTNWPSHEHNFVFN